MRASKRSLKGWMKRWLWLMVSSLFVVVSGCDDDTIEQSTTEPVEAMTLTGVFNMVTQISGDAADIIIADRQRAIDELGSDYEFAAVITQLDDHFIEVRAVIPQLNITLNDATATTDETGHFVLNLADAVAGDVVTVSDSDNSPYFDYIITDADIVNQRLQIDDAVDFDAYVEKVQTGSCHLKTAATATASYPCLDNNGISAYGFTYSDCYMSLFYGPANYSWMCWYELMNTIHDHYGNIWCNGTQNCSLFVHNWNWSCQSYHKHSGYWKVGSSCW